MIIWPHYPFCFGSSLKHWNQILSSSITYFFFRLSLYFLDDNVKNYNEFRLDTPIWNISIIYRKKNVNFFVFITLLKELFTFNLLYVVVMRFRVCLALTSKPPFRFFSFDI